MELIQPNKHQNLYGHESLEKEFINLWEKNSFPHAIILSGQKGVGKATLAFKISRFILSKNGEIEDKNYSLLLNETKSSNNLNIDIDSIIFKEIYNNVNQNLIILEQKTDDETSSSNEIIVDEIRKLKLFFERKSINMNWRIAIIDSVDDLNINASNALLKILEEPPEKSLIILISHAPGNLLKTIKSRCVEFKLKSLNFCNFKKILSTVKSDLKDYEVEYLGTLTNNRPGYSIQIIERNGIEIYNQMLKIFNEMPQFNIEMLNKLDVLVNKRNNINSYNILINLINGFIHRAILHIYNIERNKNIEFFDDEIQIFNNLFNEDNIINVINTWFSSKDIIDKAEIFNLNKKSVLFDFFAEFSNCLK